MSIRPVRRLLSNMQRFSEWVGPHNDFAAFAIAFPLVCIIMAIKIALE